ncbi:MAG: nitroreductase family deazaflavin-dependent oxidoreductase [Acidobacteriota bacterium]
MPIKYLYLTTTGRITGKPREIEIWFVEHGGKFYILAEHLDDTQWVKNIKHDGRVRVRLGDRTFEAIARVLDYNRDRNVWLTAQALAREKYDWGDGLPVELTPK